MKRALPILYIISAFVLYSCAPDQYAQTSEYDDLYFSSKDKEKAIKEGEAKKAESANSTYNATDMSSAGSSAGTGRDVDYSQYKNKDQSVKTTSGGDTYITNNYGYDSFQDRWDRQNNWCYTCNMSNLSIGSYYDPWGWSGPRSSISFRYSTGWGWNSYYGYNSYDPWFGPRYGYAYDPFYNNYWGYNSWYGSPYYGYGFNNFYGYPGTYNNGYYQGFYNGYYSGKNNSGNYYNDGGSSGNNRPRSRNQPRTTVGSVINSGSNSNNNGTRPGNPARRVESQNQYNGNVKSPDSYRNPGTSQPSTQPSQPAIERRRVDSYNQPRQQSYSQPSQPSNNYHYQNNNNNNNYRQDSYHAPASTPSGGGGSSPGRGGSNNGGSSPSRNSNRPANKSF